MEHRTTRLTEFHLKSSMGTSLDLPMASWMNPHSVFLMGSPRSNEGNPDGVSNELPDDTPDRISFEKIYGDVTGPSRGLMDEPSLGLSDGLSKEQRRQS